MCFCSYFNMSTTKQSWCVTPPLGVAPFCKVVALTLFGDNECIADWKPGICKVIFTYWDMEICYASIIEHCRVRRQSIPPAKHIIKLHVKPTNCQAILCDATFAITSCLTHFCSSTAVYMCSVNGA